jgi:hypothetical protein
MHTETILRGNPARPSDRLLAGSGAPQSRRQMRHPIVIVYEKRIETVPRELKALKAVWEPGVRY